MADMQTASTTGDTLVPVTVLTGYLGAGKTTLLNRILTENHGRKYAVVINEFGELGVDNDLVVDTDEEVFEMNNGCICCTVRGDLIRIVGGLMKRRGKFDGIIIETTGLANPAPVAQTFFVDEGVRARTRLDAIVTVVDAKNLLARLDDSEEAAAQIAFADVIVLNKTDLVDAAGLDAVEARIRTINAYAKIHRALRSNVDIAAVLDQGAFDLARILDQQPDFLTETEHGHNEDINSMSFELAKPVDPEKFNAWIGQLLADKGQDLLRTKGILSYAGDDRRFAFQAVHMIADGGFIGTWPAESDRRSKLVFIGRNLNRPQLRRGFEGVPGLSQTAEWLLSARGQQQELDAFVVAAAWSGDTPAFALGDGTVRMGNQRIMAHDGGVLALAATPTGFVTGGDDGVFQRITRDGSMAEIAQFGMKWVEQVAVHGSIVACAVGKLVHLYEGGTKLKTLEHPSTVTGLAFDAKGKRIAASHYNGATIWFVAAKTDSPRRLEWKGSHTGIALHPAGEAVVTAMQENSLHGWRLSDGQHMRMSGYPSKTQAMGFTRSGKWLASSGADTVVLWPFFGGGPMGKSPTELAGGDNVLCTMIAVHPQAEMVAAGFADGLVVLADIATARILPIAPPGHGSVSALAWSGDGSKLAFGTESGFAALVDLSKR